MKSVKIKGREFPILAVAVTEHFGRVPVLDIRQKEDVKRKKVRL